MPSATWLPPQQTTTVGDCDCMPSDDFNLIAPKADYLSLSASSASIDSFAFTAPANNTNLNFIF